MIIDIVMPTGVLLGIYEDTCFKAEEKKLFLIVFGISWTW